MWVKDRFLEYLEKPDSWLHEGSPFEEESEADADETSSMKSTSSKSSEFSALTVKSLIASKHPYPQDLLLWENLEPIDERLRSLEDYDEKALTEKIAAIECLYYKAQQISWEIARACKMASPISLGEKDHVQPVFHAFFSVAAHDILGLSEVQISAAAKKIYASMGEVSIGCIPDAVILLAPDDGSPADGDQIFSNVEVEKNRKATEWASVNQLVWNARAFLQRWAKNPGTFFGSSERFEHISICTNLQYSCFISANSMPGEDVWHLKSSRLISDGNRIAKEFFYSLHRSKENMMSMHFAPASSTDVGESRSGRTGERKPSTDEDSSQSWPPRGTGGASQCPGKREKQNKNTRAKQGSLQDAMTCDTSSASTLFNNPCTSGEKKVARPNVHGLAPVGHLNLEKLGQMPYSDKIRMFLQSF